MLVNITSLVSAHIRTSISATIQSTSTLAQSLKSSLGLTTATEEKKHQSRHGQQQHRPQLDSRSLDYSRQVETAEQSAPLQHEQYPSLQPPWRGLDRRFKNYGLSMPLSPNYSAPRHPIVLCHGLFGFDKRGPEAIPHLQIHYWSGIEKALTKLGAKVVVAKVPRTGAIRKRAEDLHRMLSSTMEGMPVNFLAHSMGGLDCRYLISHIQDRNYNVQSLTTLSTPHRGSPFMDWCRDNIGVGYFHQAEEEAMRKLGEAAKMSRAAVQQATDSFQDSLRAASGGIYPPPPSYVPPGAPFSPVSPLLNRLIPFLDTPAYSNLTTTYCTQVFNPNTPDDPNVAYYSYGASVQQIPLWQPLGFPWEVIQAKEGENDGLVSLSSAKWGQYIETVEADHWDLNNRWRLKIGSGQKPFDAVELYMNIATRLFRDGY